MESKEVFENNPDDGNAHMVEVADDGECYGDRLHKLGADCWCHPERKLPDQRIMGKMRKWYIHRAWLQ